MKMQFIISRIPRSLIVLFSTILALLTVPMIHAAAFSIDDGTSYDINCDGVVDNSDIELIKDSILSNKPDYHVCDIIRATRISYADVDYSPEHKIWKASELYPSDENNMFFINTFMSDFQMVIHEDDAKIYFNLIENGVIYYTTEWEKDYNVVYNLDIENDHIVETEFNGLIYKVFIHGNKYKLDIVDPNYKKPIPELTEYLVSDLSVEDSNEWIFINLFLSDFDKVVHEDSEAIYVEFLDDGITYFSIEFTKGVNIVFNKDLGRNYIAATEYDHNYYQVFVQNDKYMLNVIETNIGTAIAATFFSNDYPVTIEDINLVSDLFSDRYELNSVRAEDDYVEFYFTHCDYMAEYFIRVPYSNEVTDDSYYDEEGIDVLGSVYYGGHNYVVFSEMINDLYIVQVAAS